MNRKTIEGSYPDRWSRKQVWEIRPHSRSRFAFFRNLELQGTKTPLFRLRELNHGQEPA
jgi:hypothetical protein